MKQLIYIVLLVIVTSCTKSTDPQPVTAVPRAATFSTTIPGLTDYTGDVVVSSGSATSNNLTVTTSLINLTIYQVSKTTGNYVISNWNASYSGSADVITISLSDVKNNKLYYSTSGSLNRSETGFTFNSTLVQYNGGSASYQMTGTFKYQP